jgi:hypothetical protein
MDELLLEVSLQLLHQSLQGGNDLRTEDFLSEGTNGLSEYGLDKDSNRLYMLSEGRTHKRSIQTWFRMRTNQL